MTKRTRTVPITRAFAAALFCIFTFAFCIPSFGADTDPAAAVPTFQAVLSNGFSIHHARSEQIGSTTRLWLQNDARAGYVDVPTQDIARFEQEEVVPAPPASSDTVAPHAFVRPTISDLVTAAANKQQIDPDFVASVVRAESGFNPRALSPKGAQGLMQLMPHTASELGVHNAFDPVANVDGGTRYLRALLEQYHGDAVRTLAAYNAGPLRVAQYGGVPPYRETRAYVGRIIRDYNRKKIAADPSLARAIRASNRAHMGRPRAGQSIASAPAATAAAGQ